MKCLNCDKEISKKATYCSDKCRMAYKRKLSKIANHLTRPISPPMIQPEQNVRPNTQPEQKINPADTIPNYGQENCECMHCKSKRTNKSKNIINHGPFKPAKELETDEINRVSLPGDPDYVECQLK